MEYAVSNGHSETARVLVELGANVDQENDVRAAEEAYMPVHVVVVATEL